MRSDSMQNPRNKVGRYSGSGRAGISEMIPTERERARGLEPISLDRGRGWVAPALVLTAVAGAGIGAMLVNRAREQRKPINRLRSWAHLS